MDKEVDKIVSANPKIYETLYEHIEKQGADIPKLSIEDLPRNADLEILLTKILTYSYYLGKRSVVKKKQKKKNTQHPLSQEPPVPTADDMVKFLFDLPYDEAYKLFNSWSSIHRNEYYRDLSQNAGRAFTISWINNTHTLADIKNEFSRQMGDVFDPQKLSNVIQEVCRQRGENPLENWHLDTVIRTNTQTAYQAGWLAELKEGDDEYWEYTSVIDGRESELCEYLNGKIFPKDDPFWNEYFPPNHFNCRSTVISLSSAEVSERGLKIDDGAECLKKSGLKPSKRVPGNGFNYSPQNSLDKFLEANILASGVEPPKISTPVFKSIKEVKDYLEANVSDIHFNISKKNMQDIADLVPKLVELRKEYPSTVFDFSGIDLKVVKDMIPELIRLQKEYATKDLVYVGVNNKKNFPTKQTGCDFIMSSSPGYAFKYNNSKYALYLNKTQHSNKDELTKAIETQQKHLQWRNLPKFNGSNQAINNWAGDTANANYILYHEFGHIIDYLYNIRNNPDIINLFLKQRTSIITNGYKTAQPISSYSNTSISDFIAEAFADTQVSKNPNQMSIETLKIINKLAGI
ncbi:MAG: minor capsid protein [Candidatus Cloacimonetes bacterium]|nr:minor capsid protein [Candidatus Cloacimonadota bacterium]